MKKVDILLTSNMQLKEYKEHTSLLMNPNRCKKVAQFLAIMMRKDEPEVLISNLILIELFFPQPNFIQI